MGSTNRTNGSYKRLLARMSRLAVMNDINSLLSWDADTYMPSAGAEARGKQMEWLAGESHKLLTSRRTARLIAAAEKEVSAMGPDSDAFHQVRLIKQDYQDATRLPAKFVGEQARVHSLSQQAWAEARKRNDFSIFRPHLEKVLELARKTAEYVGYTEHPYDALLTFYEPGMTTSSFRRLFGELRQPLSDLVQRVVDKADAVSDACLQQTFAVERQHEFCRLLQRQLGLASDRCRMDQSIHPFSSGIASPFDVRITTRHVANELTNSVLSVVHEAGHGKYELGLNPAYAGTPLGSASSSGVHESQSRLWENHIGRSREFWLYWYPRLQALFPDQLGGVSLDEFYRAVNKVSRSFIRTEADELTYNLHVIVRFELELDLIEGKLPVAKLPEAWNDCFEALVGIRPSSDLQGVLQDVHWSEGAFGYFPSYTLGNLIAAQLWETMTAQIPSLPQQLGSGEYAALDEWLRVNIHQHGRRFEPAELVQRATGRPIGTEAFIRYLTDKFGKLYSL